MVRLASHYDEWSLDRRMTSWRWKVGGDGCKNCDNDKIIVSCNSAANCLIQCQRVCSQVRSLALACSLAVFSHIFLLHFLLASVNKIHYKYWMFEYKLSHLAN